MIKILQILLAIVLAVLAYKVAVFTFKVVCLIALTILIYFMLRSKFKQS